MTARLAWLLVLALCVVVAGSSGQTASVAVDPAIYDALETQSKVSVLIVLKDASSGPVIAGIEGRRARFKSAQDKLIAKLQRKADVGIAGEDGDDGSLRTLSNAPVITARINERALDLLASSSEVQSIHLSRQFTIDLATSTVTIKAQHVWGEIVNGTNLTGAGQSVCIIDTGVDDNHTSLKGKVVNQTCYCRTGGGCCQGVNESTNASDNNGHGTHVSSTAMANGTVTGVAKHASVVAVKVCDSGGSCDLLDIALALDYCINNSAAYNISVISMSISDGSSYATQGSCPTDLDALISEAVGANILVTVASGNQGNASGIGYPSCSPNATSVASTNAAGTSISSFSNRGPLLDVAAPGGSIVAARADSICSGSCSCSGVTQTCSGTSMATPHVAGVGLLLAQNARLRNRTFNPILVEQLLEETSTGVDSFRMVNALAALVRTNANLTFNGTNNSISNPSVGAVFFRTTVNQSRLGDCFNITVNNVTLVETNANCSQYNGSATVRLQGLSFHEAKPLLNGQPCSALECQNRSTNNGQLTFDVVHFSSYTAGSAANLSITDDTDNESRFVNDQVSFFANFTNTTGPVNTSTGACLIAFNTTGSYGSFQNMTFDSARQQYAFNRSFGDDFNGTFNVTCSSFNETLSTIDNMTVQNETSPPNVTLIAPANNSQANLSLLVRFTYNVTDNSSIANCSLFVNNSLNSSDFTVDKRINQTFNITASAGVVSWNITCSDVGGTPGTSATFVLNVTAVNSPPTLLANISNQSWTEDTNLTLNVSAFFNDTNGDPLTFSALVGPNVSVVMNNNTGNATLIPLTNFSGISSIVFIAFDITGANASSNNISLNVTFVNDAPSLTGTIPNQSWTQGTSNSDAFDLDSYFTDSDNGTRVYGSNGTSSITVSIDAQNEVTFTQSSSFTGNETVTFNATDGTSTVSSNAVRLQVTPSSSSGSGGGGGGGAAGCTNSCSPAGMMGCTFTGELRCGNFDEDSCLEAGIVDCLPGYKCDDTLGCVKTACAEEWLCQEWGACENSQQSRTCTELNGCGTEQFKPAVTQACTVPTTFTTQAPPAQPETPPAALVVAPPEELLNTSCGDSNCSGFEACWRDCKERYIRIPAAVLIFAAMVVYVYLRHKSFVRGPGKQGPAKAQASASQGAQVKKRL